ncbi:Os01g0163812 [Oryza sativa Japonica Group]|uniref:Os01g0163812 protein n=1 Tax=Oryza sativa subsp. japonica TaxID=39947 RepID=A0A0P0UYM0_ORYSJ|nr:Os01g0163812 [Oryza sativa Japonica Group]
MAAFHPLAILVFVSLLAAGATANYGYTTPSPSPPPLPPQVYPAGPQRQAAGEGGEAACKGTHSFEGAKPLPKAEVSVICHDAKNRVMVRCRRTVTDENGYFRAELDETKVSDFYMGDPRKACYVRLRTSLDFECNNPTNINNSSIQGAPLRDEGKRWADHDYYNVMYAAGLLAFRPAICPPKH